MLALGWHLGQPVGIEVDGRMHDLGVTVVVAPDPLRHKAGIGHEMIDACGRSHVPDAQLVSQAREIGALQRTELACVGMVMIPDVAHR